MEYLAKSDLYNIIRETVLNQLTDGNDAFLDVIEASCISKFKDYLTGRYDVKKVFLEYEAWDAVESYAIDSVIRYQNKLYKTLQIDTGTTPGTDATIWSLVFSRSEKITLMLIDCMLYELHKRVNSDQIAEHRVDSYEAAMAWLKLVNSGKINARLPFLDVDMDGKEDSDSHRFGYFSTNNVRDLF